MPDDDPTLLAMVRWTLGRLADELSQQQDSLPARSLLTKASELQAFVGPGPSFIPSKALTGWIDSEWISAAHEAMIWVAEERGLGGARSLDGLAWDLQVDAVWEAWVAAFAKDLAGRLGMIASPFGTSRRQLRWSGPIMSMGSLAPDVEISDRNRTIWIDAKYKRHLRLLARKGWTGLSSDVREQHRADLHQALAYASLADTESVDTVLLYPTEASDLHIPVTVASISAGRRSVRLLLAGLPFGFTSAQKRDSVLKRFRQLFLRT